MRKLFEAQYKDAADQALWPSIWEELKAVRKAGYCVSYGDLDSDVVGFGAPVLIEDEVIGTISLVCSKERAKFLNDAAIGAVLMAKSHELGMVLAASEDGAHFHPS
ncbi:IclR family transcriptional regulator domain-containing protein [Parapusillimonas granuli]|uniref:IclR family transcriptional regulator domain-containing protein n=1 Tax=Parapusillimonas granuli TaxID=380911 RepID=UPI0017C0695C|nr:DNA-binding IclR family transcriptional regulator [Parapusillimonas granuli]